MTSPLFERQSTGGVVARDGFGYQDAFLLQNIPIFLSQGAFSHAVSEVLGDVEVRYHRPQGDTFCVLYEAKRHQLTRNEVWKEVARFHELHRIAPDEYVRFVLVCGNYNADFEPLFRKLDRYRGPGESLNTDSAVKASAEAEIEASIIALGQNHEVAQFVLRRVTFLKYNDSDVEGAFVSALTARLSQAGHMRASEISTFRARCKALVDDSTRRPITRAQVEDALAESSPDLATAWLAVPTTVQLTQVLTEQLDELCIDVGEFNGDGRGSLGAARWQALQVQLAALGQFVHSSRKRRGLLVSAKQRMSLACTVGYCFSATRGFTLQMDHNGLVFDTAIHDRAECAFFDEREVRGEVIRSSGVVCLSFPTPGEIDMLAAASELGLSSAPTLVLNSSTVIPNIGVMNSAVSEAKAALVAFRARNRLSHLHLFIKAPSSFAMALGHRLNGVGVIQLYDWVGTAYMPTAELR